MLILIQRNERNYFLDDSEAYTEIIEMVENAISLGAIMMIVYLQLWGRWPNIGIRIYSIQYTKEC